MMAGLIDTIAPDAKDPWDAIALRQSATRATDAYQAFIALPRIHANREAVQPVIENAVAEALERAEAQLSR